MQSPHGNLIEKVAAFASAHNGLLAYDLDMSQRWRTLFISVLAALYLAGIVFVVVGLWNGRLWAIREFEQEESIAEWKEWQQKTEADSESGTTPVQRRPAASDEPPTLALLRDHFGITTLALITLGSVVYWTGSWLLCGILFGSAEKSTSDIDATTK